MLAEVAATDALSRVLAAFESLGYPRAVVEQWSIPAADAVDLISALRDVPPAAGAETLRILEVGTFVGTSALLMLLALPGCEVHTVDPNLPLDVEFSAMNCDHRGADLARRTHEVAALAAERLGVRHRLHLHQGGFSTDATFAGRAATAPAIGAELIAAHAPFDAAFIDGLHFEHAVLDDLLLAARGVRADGPLILHDAIGYWGAPVRRAISRFLERSPGHALRHPPYADLYRSVAVLSRRPAGAPVDFATRARNAHGDSSDRLAGLLARAVATQCPPLTPHARDDASHAVAEALAAAQPPDAQPSATIAIALDTLDATPFAALAPTLAGLAAGADALLLGLTPPGEQGAATAHARPLATTVDALDRIGFDAFDAIAPFLEPFVYPLGAGCVLPTHTSFLATSLLAIRRGTALHDAVRAGTLDPLDARAARTVESARTQRTHDRASLARFRAEHAALNAQLHARAAAAASPDPQRAALLAEIDSLRARLTHMLAWRVHIGRHHFWRRPDARL